MKRVLSLSCFLCLLLLNVDIGDSAIRNNEPVVWGKWGPWAQCTGDFCGFGKRSRTRRPEAKGRDTADADPSPSIVDVITLKSAAVSDVVGLRSNT